MSFELGEKDDHGTGWAFARNLGKLKAEMWILKLSCFIFYLFSCINAMLSEKWRSKYCSVNDSLHIFFDNVSYNSSKSEKDPILFRRMRLISICNQINTDRVANWHYYFTATVKAGVCNLSWCNSGQVRPLLTEHTVLNSEYISVDW